MAYVTPNYGTTSTTNTTAKTTTAVKNTGAPFTFQVRVTERDLRIRNGAGTGYASKGYIAPGIYTITEVRTGTGSKSGWGRLSDGRGYISLDWAKRLKSTYTVKISETDLRIRSGAGTNYSIKGIIKPGTYTITDIKPGNGATKGWGKLSNGTGWVSLTNSTKRVMIIGFAQVTPDEPEKVWDYVGCAYPEGFMGPDATYVFNRGQIERIYAIGYQDEEQFAFKIRIDKAMEDMKNGVDVGSI